MIINMSRKKILIITIIIIIIIQIITYHYLFYIILRKKLSNMAKDVFKVFNKNKIKYYADFGTLLGIIREGDIILYDTDVDVSIFADKQSLKILNNGIRRDLEKLGYRLKRTNENTYRILYYKNINFNFPYTDVCLNKIEGKYIVRGNDKILLDLIKPTKNIIGKIFLFLFLIKYIKL